ncbi:hypothetical protein SUGI_0042790 [Cryptomeria japonica]|nr:hypothetical protein SUGI_0042790 [Cryptomeria japonica]
MVFVSVLMRRAVIGNDRCLLYEADPSDEYRKFMKYKEALEHVCMPGENPASLWLTNRDSVDQAKERIQKGKETKCSELIDLIKRSTEAKKSTERQKSADAQKSTKKFVDQLENFEPKNFQLVKKYFPTLDESWWKMAAVSLLIIIIRLDTDGRKKAIEAYKQAWDLMSFVESSNSEQPNSIIVTQVFDIEADPVSMAADDKFKRLQENLQDSSHKLTIDDGMKVIEDEFKAAKTQLKDLDLFIGEGNENREDMEKGDVGICKGPQDSKDWNKIVPSYSMYRVCKILQSHNYTPRDIKELVDYVHICLGDVIADCLKRLPKLLIRSFGEWAVEHQDDNMWKAFRIAGKCKQVVQDSELKPVWETPELKTSQSTEGQDNQNKSS